ncbi:hypothetical protein BASA81_004827 [Batrachochytrium salamandrivorans]|nr:hypothetical protein BASA81_004827 [Batrachochytrium salamandrivorans]
MGRTAGLAKGNKADKEKIDVINKLIQAMHSSDPPNNKMRSAQVLNNKVVMGVLLDLGVGPSSDKVSTEAIVALLQLVHDDDNGKRLFQEHPGLISALATKMESSAGQVPEVTLWVLNNLSVNPQIQREMFVSNPKLVPQMMVAVKSYSGSAQASALAVLSNFALNSDNEREMFVNYPTLAPLLIATAESGTERAQYEALRGLSNLTFGQENKREMFGNHPALIPLLVAVAESGTDRAQEEALKMLVGSTSNPESIREMFVNRPNLFPLMITKVEFGTEQVRKLALAVLWHLSNNENNAVEMLSSCSSKLLPLLAGQVFEETMRNMHGGAVMATISVLYNLSLAAANRSVLLNYGNLVAVALAKGSRSGELRIAMISILALINVFGADSNAFKLNENILENLCDTLEDTMLVGSAQIDNPLLAIRHLCVVKSYRQMFWNVGGFQYTILEALEQAIQDKNISAMNNATLILAQFINDPEALAWMCGNGPELQRVFAQLGPFPEALSTAQTLLRTMEPPF